jgi:hypothetical protein
MNSHGCIIEKRYYLFLAMDFFIDKLTLLLSVTILSMQQLNKEN